MTTVAHWLGPPERPLLGWLTTRATGPTDSGVLVLPPIGYEWWSAHRTLRTVAERLAEAGHVVLRIDYDGTGDSSGAARDPDRVAAWRASARAGAEALRELGCRRLTVVGARLGALIALLDGETLQADAVVAWEPPASGRRFARELRVLSAEPVPGDDDAAAVAGTIFAGATLADLQELDPRRLTAPPASRVVLVGGGLDTPAAQLAELGAAVERAEPEGAREALEVPAEEAVVPGAVVAALVAGAGPAEGEPLAVPAEDPEAVVPWEAGQVRERVLRLGPQGLVGVLTTPVDGPGRTVVVWLNSGSEPHVGPGRAWVEYARALALRGEASLRLDFSGWGESPDLGHAPGRPYDAHGVDEADSAVAALHELGYERVVLAGLCAGAWIALRAVLARRVAGVVALNPQLYWRPGDPVEALMRDTRARRTAEREREARGGRLGLWTLLDVLGHRSWAGRWLDAVAATDVPVLLCFAEGDDGLEYLRNRVAHRLARVTARERMQVVEVPEIDHSMHRAWLRDRVVDAVGDFVASVA